jgi:hypothetical protein
MAADVDSDDSADEVDDYPTTQSFPLSQQDGVNTTSSFGFNTSVISSVTIHPSVFQANAFQVPPIPISQGMLWSGQQISLPTVTLPQLGSVTSTPGTSEVVSLNLLTQPPNLVVSRAPTAKRVRKSAPQMTPEGLQCELLGRQLNLAQTKITSLDSQLSEMKKKNSILETRVRLFEDRENASQFNNYFPNSFVSQSSASTPPRGSPANDVVQPTASPFFFAAPQTTASPSHSAASQPPVSAFGSTAAAQPTPSPSGPSAAQSAAQPTATPSCSAATHPTATPPCTLYSTANCNTILFSNSTANYITIRSCSSTAN